MWIQKFLFLNFEQNWSYKTEGMEKIEKNSSWKFELKFGKNWPYHQRELKKIEMKKSYISFMLLR
jgi:hypothetical protein